ncbi:DUF6843 domain-containing protein [Priestia endophytica]|uniref:DUF6843 domain-containing protein n=1 Tax=Priestia endophytica TaxID=135735 RepID=UPI002E1EE6D2|nr:hypothetical protein [Priestia endophytica]
MKRVFLGTFLLFVLCACNQDKQYPNLFYIKDGYVGWVEVEYNKEGAFPTSKEGTYNVLWVDENGKAETEEPPPEQGWANNRYYYFAENGDRKELKQSEKIHGATTTRKNNEEKAIEYFFVGSEKQFEAHKGEYKREGKQ